ncbi:MAG: TetR/AcrR family transcriptional regulator [Acidimicrobiia bacterium]|nr:TetR/AcrR family transcriptional regulator [Acidimicrobiia bacterium]
MAAGTTSTTKGARTRRRLIDAARERFARDGYRATSVAQISRDAGVGPSTAFIHFANKEALFFVAVDDDLTTMFHELASRFADPKTHGLLADELLGTLVELVEEHPLAKRLLAGLEPDSTGRVLESASFQGMRAEVTRLIQNSQRMGYMRADLSSERLADGLVAMLLGVTMASVQLGPAIPEGFGPGFGEALRALFTREMGLDGPSDAGPGPSGS